MVQLTQTLILALIASVVATLLIVPLTKKDQKGESTNKRLLQSLILVLIATFIIAFGIIYITKIDLHWTVIAYALPMVAILGTVFSKGVEQTAKGVVFLASLVVIGYMITAPLFNADEKYDSAKMEEKVEIEPFDEKKTPASVPPSFAQNKMKKAFGQVQRKNNTWLFHDECYRFNR